VRTRRPRGRQLAARGTRGRVRKPTQPSYQGSGRSEAKPERREHERLRQVGLRNKRRSLPVEGVTPLHEASTCSVGAISQLLRLDEGYLRRLGLSDTKIAGQLAVKIPFVTGAGQIAAVRYVTTLGEVGGLRWRSSDKPVLYGLNRLADAERLGWVVLLFDERECWVAWRYGIPAVAVPMLCQWDPRWARSLAGLAVYVLPSSGGVDLTKMLTNLPDAKVVNLAGHTSLAAAHAVGADILHLLDGSKALATPMSEYSRNNSAATLAELEADAKPLLIARDPLTDVRAAIEALGYGGDVRTAMVVYLAVTTRVLLQRRGGMLANILVLGPPSAGKSYTYSTVLKLLPQDACHYIDAGSPRVLIYDQSDLRHKVVIFSESDSLPAGEDNPAASAIRNLLQDGRLHYQVVERDEDTGSFAVREIDREGPTVLLTTSTRHLGTQLESRMLVLDVPDDVKQIRAALEVQAQIEEVGPPTVPSACDMASGSSGGGWIVGGAFVNGVTSYGYTGAGNKVYSPYFGQTIGGFLSQLP